MKKLSILLISMAAMLFAACSGAKPEETKADADVYTAKPGETINVKVTTTYEPKEIKVKKGRLVKMVFTRVDDKNCGDELVFPKLGIKKTLPVGEPVPVEFTPTESGDIQFTCGMDMMRGKVIAE